METKYLTVTECANMIRVNGNSIVRWLKQGRFSGTRFGKKYSIDRESFEKYIESCKMTVEK